MHIYSRYLSVARCFAAHGTGVAYPRVASKNRHQHDEEDVMAKGTKSPKKKTLKVKDLARNPGKLLLEGGKHPRPILVTA
jgi:hypothetical protein